MDRFDPFARPSANGRYLRKRDARIRPESTSSRHAYRGRREMKPTKMSAAAAERTASIVSQTGCRGMSRLIPGASPPC
jgi:hypothetical protein